MELHLGDEGFLQKSNSGVISTALCVPSPHLALSSSCDMDQVNEQSSQV